MQNKRLSILFALVALLVLRAGTLRAENPPPTLRIINGTTAPSKMFPAVAGIYLDEGICTGTLVSPDYILTAGHCAFDGRSRVVKDLSRVVIEINGERRGVQAIHVHPRYDDHASACSEGVPDASLFKLDRPVTSARPIKLASSPPKPGATLLLVGYGMLGGGKNGQNGAFPDEGSLAYGYTVIDQVSATFLQWKFKSVRPGANTAGGDSGGPAFQTVKNELVISGITCGGTGNAEYGTESLDTRADILREWTGKFFTSSRSTPPAIRMARIIEVRAGKSVKLPIKVSGAGPITVSVEGLPEGLRLKSRTVRGMTALTGTFTLVLKAENEFGITEQSVRLVVRAARATALSKS